jgi:hypothetical protein
MTEINKPAISSEEKHPIIQESDNLSLTSEDNINTKKHKSDYNHPENPIPYNENNDKYEVLNNIKSDILFIAKEIINEILYLSGKSGAIVNFQIKKVDCHLFILYYYYPINILKYFVVRVDLPEICLVSNLKTVCEYMYESYNVNLNFPYKRHFYTPNSGWKLINQNLIILYNDDKFLLVPKNIIQDESIISVHMVDDNKLINDVINTSLEKAKNNDTVSFYLTEIYNSVRNYIGSLFS